MDTHSLKLAFKLLDLRLISYVHNGIHPLISVGPASKDTCIGLGSNGHKADSGQIVQRKNFWNLRNYCWGKVWWRLYLSGCVKEVAQSSQKWWEKGIKENQLEIKNISRTRGRRLHFNNWKRKGIFHVAFLYTGNATSTMTSWTGMNIVLQVAMLGGGVNH